MQVKYLNTLVALALGLTMGSAVYAQTPAGSTGECKDGTYTSAGKKSGACSGHGGVKDWYAEKKKSSTTSSKASTATAPAPAAKSTDKAAAPAAAATSAKPMEKATAMPTAAAAGGGPGKVWVNTSSKVYHCPNDRYYGKTKQGAYMTEAAAKAAGDRPSHGKACS